eukprot:1003979-Pelagomonas_calceolata.AAC.1
MCPEARVAKLFAGNKEAGVKQENKGHAHPDKKATQVSTLADQVTKFILSTATFRHPITVMVVDDIDKPSISKAYTKTDELR